VLALIDGDVLAHRSCTNRSIGIPPPGFEHLTQVIDLTERKEISEYEDSQFLQKCWNLFVKELESVLETTYASDFLMGMKHPANFRKDMFPDYKIGRHKDPSKMNRFVPMIRHIAVKEGLAIYGIGREVDDLLRMWHTQALEVNEPHVVVSIDKDLRCMPGTHYNPQKRECSIVTDYEALELFYRQLLMGDQSDSIPGLPGIGPIKAEKLLKEAYSEEEMQIVVAYTYREVMGDGWYDWLLSNGKMIYIQRHEHDWFTCRDWTVVQELLAEDKAAKKEVTPVSIPLFVSSNEGSPAAPVGGLASAPPLVPRLAPPPPVGVAIAPPLVPPPRASAAPQGVPPSPVSVTPPTVVGKIAPRPFTGQLNLKK
jgi:hypothetical protein